LALGSPQADWSVLPLAASVPDLMMTGRQKPLMPPVAVVLASWALPAIFLAGGR
jgi:hypothetical protein